MCAPMTDAVFMEFFPRRQREQAGTESREAEEICLIGTHAGSCPPIITSKGDKPHELLILDTT